MIVLPLADPAAYLARYAEVDKARSGLAGLAAADWPVPYWLVDASFSAMLMLLAARDVGLGALFFRLHQDPGPLLAALGVPEGRQVIGALALGYEEQDPEGLHRFTGASRREAADERGGAPGGLVAMVARHSRDR